MNVTGTLTVITEAEAVGSNKQIMKRTCVVHTDEQYPQDLEIEFIKDATSMLNGYNVDDKVSVDVNVRGRKWTKPDDTHQYFTSLQGWRISLLNEKKKEEENSDDPF